MTPTQRDNAAPVDQHTEIKCERVVGLMAVTMARTFFWHALIAQADCAEW